jgi:hypothetical protein
VPAQVRRGAWYDHEVSGAGDDVPVAARADVALRGLERVHHPDLDVLEVDREAAHPKKAQRTRTAATTRAIATNT